MNALHLKAAPLALLFFWQTLPPASASFRHFRYQRAITLPSGSVQGEACAVLDADVFAHAGPALKDLRLFSGDMEVPYSRTVSEPAQQDTDEARILNLETHAGGIAFDLEMPLRPYTSVVLDLAPRDFIATATIFGAGTPGSASSKPLGTYTLFDLSSQHLFHGTAIPLPESNYAYLHVELALAPASGGSPSLRSLNAVSTLRSASVPPSREAQTLYTAAGPAETLVQAGQDSVATFHVAARIPIERVAFTLPPTYQASFSRSVRIEARAIADPGTRDTSGPAAESTSGTILHLQRFVAGHNLVAEQLAVNVALGSNMQEPAEVQVHVENTTDAAPPLSVQLQMRQRSICFDAAAGSSPLTLYYGDSALGASLYTGASAGLGAGTRVIATLGPEMANPAFTAAPSSPRHFSQRPVLRWIALLGFVGVFAMLVIRRTHRFRH